MKSLRTRLTFTHALVAIIAVAIVAVLATVLIRAAFNRFAPQAAANNLAWILAERGQDLDRALQLAQTAVSVAPERPELIDTLGWVYYKKNQPRQAILYFQQCIEKSPTVAEYHYHLGLALVKAGDPTGGRASLQRALDLKPNAAVAAEIRKALEGIAN